MATNHQSATPNYLDDEMMIACCKTCTLAQNRKVCHACAFAIGLTFKQAAQAHDLQPVRATYVAQVEAIQKGV